MSARSDLVNLDAWGDPADLIVAFLNTLDTGVGIDAMDNLDGWTSWLSAQGLDERFGASEPGGLQQARELRADLRALASGRPRERGSSVDLQVGLSVDGKVELSAPTAAGFFAAAAVTVAMQHRMDRVKICPADDCGWAFYDNSRNRSRQWCSMKVCGNRAKARAHRLRSTRP